MKAKRNRRKKLKQIRLRMIASLLVIALAMVLSWFSWLTSPVDSSLDKPIDFSIRLGESIDSIGLHLKETGLIRSKVAFKITVVSMSLAKRIQAGEFKLSKDMSTKQIAQTLTLGRADISVTLIEGWRREEFAGELEKQFAKKGEDFDKSKFLTLTAESEGYLFPDTYSFSPTATEEDVANILKDTFNKKINQEIRKAINTQSLSLEQGVIIASMLEREARSRKDLPVVAGIIIKRFKNNWPLQVDATVQYILGYQDKEASWWKKALTIKDLEISSPYNTYAHPGLPPAPICNPSLDALIAVSDQQPSDYWYYLSDTEGNLHYAETLEEHNANVAKYLGK